VLASLAVADVVTTGAPVAVFATVVANDRAAAAAAAAVVVAKESEMIVSSSVRTMQATVHKPPLPSRTEP